MSRLFSLVILAFSVLLVTPRATAAEGPATHFRLTAAPAAYVYFPGPFSITVTALDASKTTVTGYRGTVHFTSNSGTLPADYTFVAADNGVHTFNVFPTIGGAHWITATDTANPSIHGTGGTTVLFNCPPGVAPRITTSRICANSSGNRASVMGVGPASLLWTITNGTITAGQGTSSITFTAGASGNVSFEVAATGAGPCFPSRVDGHAEILPSPDADLGADLRGCIGMTANVRASLTGTPPFTVRWSDGLVQSDIETDNVTRIVTIEGDRTYTIDSVTDAVCTLNDMHTRIRVLGTTLPVIDSQSQRVLIRRGQSAMLTVSTSTPYATYQWFEGNPGDTSTPVGSDSPALTTPELQRTSRYWARLSTSCGSTDSAPILVQVSNAKRRAARR